MGAAAKSGVAPDASPTYADRLDQLLGPEIGTDPREVHRLAKCHVVAAPELVVPDAVRVLLWHEAKLLLLARSPNLTDEQQRSYRIAAALLCSTLRELGVDP